MFQWGALPRGLWACSEADLGDMPQRGCWREAQSEMQEMRKIPVGRPNYRKMGPVIKLGWARNNNTVDTLECGECDGTTLICWRGFSHEQSARQTGNFLWDGGARRADGQREKKSPTEVRVATKRAELVVVVVVGSVARKCGDRNRQNHEHFACAHRHNAVSVQGSITHTIVRALLHNMQGCASSQGRIWTARCRRHAHAAGAGAYRSRFAVEIDFQGSAIYGRRHAVRHRRGRGSRLGAAHLAAR